MARGGLTLGVAALSILTAAAAAPSAIGDAHAAKPVVVHTYQLDGALDPATGGLINIYVDVKRTSAGKFVPISSRSMSVGGLDLPCDEGTFTNKGFHTYNYIKINSAGRFHYDFVGYTAAFTGKVTKHGRKVVGTVSYGPNTVYNSDAAEDWHNCVLPNSPVDYTAHFTKRTY